MPGFLIVFGYADVSSFCYWKDPIPCPCLNTHRTTSANGLFHYQPKNPIGYNISTQRQKLLQSLISVGALVACIFIFNFGRFISP